MAEEQGQDKDHRNGARHFTRRQSFFVAAHWGGIAAQICAEQNADIAGVLGAEAAESLARHRNAQADEHDYVTICAAFFAKTYPVSAAKERNPEIMGWITERYLNDMHNGKQILLEDIYKIGDQVQYFSGLKASGKLPANDNLMGYESLQALAARLAPFEAQRAKKAQERLERHMPPEMRTRIRAETSILYSGKAGDIVLPHTPFSSQYWGNNTKWCVSGKEYAQSHFPHYNKNSPVIMLLPKDGEKMALVDRKFWSADDEAHDAPSAEVAWLWDEAARHDASIMNKLERYRPKNSAVIPPKTDPRSTLPELTEEEQEWVTKIVEAAQARHFFFRVPQAIAQNKSIIIRIVGHHGFALKYATQELRADKEVVLEAVKQDAEALNFAVPELRADKEVLLQAVKQEGFSLQFAGQELQADKEVVLEALKQNRSALQYAAPELQQKGVLMHYALEHAEHFPEFVLTIRDRGDAFDTSDVPDETILQAHITALEVLLEQGKDGIAREHLRFIKPLWGDGTRIFGDPREQLQYLERLSSVAVGVLYDYGSDSFSL